MNCLPAFPLRVTLLLPVFLSLLHANVQAQTPAPGTVWRYQLLEASQSIDDCPVCDRIPIVLPLRGSFDLRCLYHDPLYSHYALENVTFFTTSTNGLEYKMTGQGLLDIGGQLATRQTVSLDLLISNGFITNSCSFTNSNLVATRRWPMLQINLGQTNGTITQQYYLDLNAAPLQEIWFSTVRSFSAGIWNSPTNIVSQGDLLSITGRIVKNNHALAARLGVEPPVPDLGLKDFDILAGGEIVFSIERDVFSEVLSRTVNHGDLISDRGTILMSNQQLVANFEPDTPGGSVGLDAVKLLDNGEVWFSVQTNFQSKALAGPVGTGDLLSAKSGSIIRSNPQLLAPFKPLSGTGDAGLRAFYVWPGGEIWFVTEKGFYDVNSAFYEPGDVLSDQGYVVYRAAELLSAFEPAQSDPAPGVDALFVVTDAATTSSAPALSAPQPTNSPPSSLVLNWEGVGRVFQPEVATNLAGPFLPAGPISPDQLFLDPGAVTNRGPAFYRLRQW